MSGKIYDNCYKFLCDSDAALTANNKHVWDQVKGSTILEKGSDCLIIEIYKTLIVLGKAGIPCEIEGSAFLFKNYVLEDLSFDVVLGRDFFNTHRNR